MRELQPVPETSSCEDAPGRALGRFFTGKVYEVSRPAPTPTWMPQSAIIIPHDPKPTERFSPSGAVYHKDYRWRSAGSFSEPTLNHIPRRIASPRTIQPPGAVKSFSPALQNHGEQEAAGSAPAGHPLRRLGNGGATGASPQPAWARSPQAAACAYGTARARALLPLPAERNGPGRAGPLPPHPVTRIPARQPRRKRRPGRRLEVMPGKMAAPRRWGERAAGAALRLWAPPAAAARPGRWQVPPPAGQRGPDGVWGWRGTASGAGRDRRGGVGRAGPGRADPGAVGSPWGCSI